MKGNNDLNVKNDYNQGSNISYTYLYLALNSSTFMQASSKF